MVVGLHGNAVARAAYNAGAQHVILCDANSSHGENILWEGVDENRVTVTNQHTLRLGSGLRVDVVILDIFTSTINRWAPVYVMRDLLKRGILRTFSGRLPYVCPTKSTMCLRVYHSPTFTNPGDASGKKIKWTHAGVLTDTDLYSPVSARVDVLHEQYDNPAQTWPETITLTCSKNHGCVAVLEWAVMLYSGAIMTHLVQRTDASHAVRLHRVGIDYFAWTDDQEKPVTFVNSPKLTGGVNLTPSTPENPTLGDISLTIAKMDAAIERWFGVLTSMQNSF